MLVLLLAQLCCAAVAADGRDVTRDYFGDIFRMRGCVPRNASLCDRGGARFALEIPGRPCYCQCAPSHFTYREDKAQCIKDIRECYMSVFYRPYAVEAIPLVFLPTSGQLVHPDAHLSLAGRRRPPTYGLPRCKATVSQFMTKEGWRTITRENGGPVFSLFQDGNKTFLQFLGSAQDRHTLQQHLVLVRMFCKIPEYAPFETCVAIRVGWAPGVEQLQSPESSGSKANMMVVGLSLGVLGMIYVLAVLIYLKFRRRNSQKASGILKGEDDTDPSEEGNGLQGLDPSKRLELYHTHSLGRHKTSHLGDKIWKPFSLNETFDRSWTERPVQLGCEFSVQEFQLRPEHFEPEVLASPPQPVMDYLQRLQDSMTYARHRLRMCYRYQPTLLGIPEDDYFYQESANEDNSDGKEKRTTPDGVSSSSNTSIRKKNFIRVGANLNRVPKPPPRKSRRSSKDGSIHSESSTSCSRSPTNGSETEEEKFEIQNAMDTLNDTLEAIEYDIFKQDLLDSEDTHGDRASSVRAVETSSMKGEKRIIPAQVTDEESDNKEFDSSSCSSLSVITVLGKGPQLPPTNKRAFSSSEFHNIDPNLHLLNSTGSCCGDIHASDVSKDYRQLKSSYLTNGSALRHPSLSRMHKSPLIDKGHNLHYTPGYFGDIQRFPLQENRVYSRTASGGDISSHCDETEYDTEITEATDTEMTEITESECACSGDDASTTKASSTESTTATANTTLDSLESQPSSVEDINIPTTVMNLWLSRLLNNSHRCKHGRKSRKKPEKIKSDDNWEHICQKRREPCPVHDVADGSSLIDRLVQNGTKSITGSDVSSYFQALKEDVLMEHIKGWLTTQKSRKPKLGITVKTRNRNSVKPVPLPDSTSMSSAVTDSGFHSSWSSINLPKSLKQPETDYSSLQDEATCENKSEHLQNQSNNTEPIESISDEKIFPQKDNELVEVVTE